MLHNTDNMNIHNNREFRKGSIRVDIFDRKMIENQNINDYMETDNVSLIGVDNSGDIASSQNVIPQTKIVSENEKEITRLLTDHGNNKDKIRSFAELIIGYLGITNPGQFKTIWNESGTIGYPIYDRKKLGKTDQQEGIKDLIKMLDKFYDIGADGYDGHMKDVLLVWREVYGKHKDTSDITRTTWVQMSLNAAMSKFTPIAKSGILAAFNIIKMRNIMVRNEEISLFDLMFSENIASPFARLCSLYINQYIGERAGPSYGNPKHAIIARESRINDLSLMFSYLSKSSNKYGSNDDLYFQNPTSRSRQQQIDENIGFNSNNSRKYRGNLSSRRRITGDDIL